MLQPWKVNRRSSYRFSTWPMGNNGILRQTSSSSSLVLFWVWPSTTRFVETGWSCDVRLLNTTCKWQVILDVHFPMGVYKAGCDGVVLFQPVCLYQIIMNSFAFFFGTWIGIKSSRASKNTSGIIRHFHALQTTYTSLEHGFWERRERRQKLMYGTCAKLGLQDLLDFQPSLAQAAWWMIDVWMLWDWAASPPCVFFRCCWIVTTYRLRHVSWFILIHVRGSSHFWSMRMQQAFKRPSRWHPLTIRPITTTIRPSVQTFGPLRFVVEYECFGSLQEDIGV